MGVVDDARNGSDRSRGPLEEAIFAGLGWASLTVSAADELADELARRVGLDREEMRKAVRDTVASWRHEGDRLGGLPGEALERLVRRVGLVRREEVDDLVLRVAQLEHRLRLLESPVDR